MDINDLADQEKSALLSKVMGWGIEEEYSEDIQKSIAYWTSWISDATGTPIEFPCGDNTIEWTSPAFKPSWREFKLNLYKPANMALAKRVFVWAYVELEKARMQFRHGDWAFRILLKEEGARWGLDKILALAIEAGLVAEEERDDG